MKKIVVFLLITLYFTPSYAEVGMRTLNKNGYTTNSQNASQNDSNNEKKLRAGINIDTQYEIMNFKQGLVDTINMDIKVDDRTEDISVGTKIKF